MSKIVILDENELEALLLRVFEKGRASVVKAPEVWTLKQAAQQRGIGESTLRSYVARGVVPFFRQGGKIMFRSNELEQWEYDPAKENGLSFQKELKTRAAK